MERKIINERRTWEYISKSGRENPDSKIGVYAAEAESYKVFWNQFRPIISSYHDLKSLDDNFCHPLSSFQNLPPKIIHPKLITVLARIARNLRDFPFPASISGMERMEVCNLIINALKDIPGHFYYLDQVTENVKNKLQSKKLLFGNSDRFMKSAGFCQKWSQGRVIFVSKYLKVHIWINEEDHLRIMCIAPNADFESCIFDLLLILRYLELKLSFAYSKKLGFLTSCPSNLGTGFRASLHARCNKDEIKQLEKLGLDIRSCYGENHPIEGDIYDISIKQRLGITESQIINKLYEALLTIL